jgi:hypothetical protein
MKALLSLFPLLTILALNSKAQIFDTLPVIVHVIHNGESIGSGKNISQAQVYSQFDVLNEDYRMQNADLANTPSAFMPFAADMGLNFAKAMTDPGGNPLPEPGINRISRSSMNWSAGPYTPTYIDNTIKPQTIWDPTQYLNIWVLDLGNGMLSYNTFPDCPGFPCAVQATADSTRDGIVVHYRAFGRTGNLSVPYHKGRSATYSIAQWLGLRRLSQANCGDDCVSDTPIGEYNVFGCPSYPVNSSCNTSADGEMFMNFMSYVDDSCKVMFTQGQKARIDTVLSCGYFQSALRTSSVITSIKENADPTFGFYPNPSQGEVTLYIKGNRKCSVAVYSPMGVKVFEAIADPAQTLNLPSAIGNGVYFIDISAGEARYTGKLLLAR